MKMDDFNKFIFDIAVYVPIAISIISFLVTILSLLLKKVNKTAKRCLCLCAFLIFCISTAIAFYKTTLVAVPKVVNISYESAIQTLQEHGLILAEFDEKLVNNSIIVVEQSPVENTIVRKNSKITLKVKTIVPTSGTGEVVPPPTVINSIGNKYYQNNDGHICAQGDSYYIATDDSIYWTDSDFQKFIKLVEADSPMNLNVIGNDIYYSTENGIYRVKYDGTDKKLLFDTNCRTLKIQVLNGVIYFIKADDTKLYYGPTSGGKYNNVYNKDIANFTTIGLQIFVCNAEVERFSSNNYPKRTSARSISAITLNGEAENIIYAENNDIFKRVNGNLGVYENALYFLTQEGLYSINEGVSKVCDINFGDALCIIDNYAFYTTSENNHWEIVKYDLVNKVSKVYTVPIDNIMVVPQYVYPTNDKIVFSVDLSTWYSIDQNNGSFSILNIS